ncbi:peptidase M48-like protein [Nocardia tenerifensis]|uniref:Peptidase M48-like protein n=1 Tax=Nocardia tenerifensis TaxID=228006 RepID=A0A318JVX6_9NOCA|nr:M48 family metalloprotease [Nocardia tenerifensis]PXX61121.1 peptidase M48-like protein [Nocardia tenerifensis]
MDITVESEVPAVPVRAGALAAGTSLRFTLLLAFITFDSLFLLSSTATWYQGGSEWFEICRLAVGYDPRQAYTPTETLINSGFIESCQTTHGLQAPTDWMLLAVVAVAAVAIAIYLLWPTWRRRRLLRIDLHSTDELAAELRDLVAVAGLRTSPEFAIDPRSDAVGAVVFGRLGRYTVCLDAGLIAHRSAAPGVLRDVALHELAHIRNRDVDIAYATVAVWRAFLLCALLPHLIGQAVSLATATETWREDWQLGLRGLIRVAVLVALTYLVRADILRTREFYADLDAANLAGRSAFTWRDNHAVVQPRTAVLHRFIGIWRTHPDISERLRSLRDPGILFGANALPMFLTGVVAQVANVSLPAVVDSFGLPWDQLAVERVSTWVTAALVVGIAGYALWRVVGYAVLTGRPVPSGWGAGVWLGAGMAVGELVSFRTAGFALLPRGSAILLVFVISGPVFTWWITQCAELWIRGWAGRSIRPVRILGSAAALVVFGTWYGYWMSGPFLFLIGPLRSPQLATAGLPSWFWFVADLANRPLVLAGAAVLWLFPLVPLLRKPRTGTPGWVERARTDPPDGETTIRQPVSLRPALAGAVLGGGLCWVAVVVVMLVLHADQPPREASNTEWILRYPMWLTVGLGLATVATAIIVSATTRRYRLAIALAASGGAGLMGLAGLFVFAAVDGCVGSMRVLAYTCDIRPHAAWLVVTLQVPFVLGLALTLAALGALVGAVLVDGGRLVLRRRAAASTEVSARPESLFRRRLLVTAAAAAVAILGVDTALNYYVRDGPDVAPVATIGNEPPPTPEATYRKVWAWLRVGGHDKVIELGEDFRKWGEATGEAARAAQEAGEPTVDLDPDVFGPICTAVARAAHDAAAFIPIPDERAQQDWAKAYTVGEQAGSDCRNSFGAKDDALFGRSMTEGVEAVTAYQSLMRYLHTIGVLTNG